MPIYLTIIMHNVSTVFVAKANIIAGYAANCHRVDHLCVLGR